MVAQPYTAQIAKGAAFKKTIEVPYLFNYSIPVDQAVGLGSGIDLAKNSVSNKYSMNFNLSAVNEDITVTLYYVAGTAKYTVMHYYQDLEDGSRYTMDPKTVELTGDIDAYTQAVANNKKGFRCKGIPQTTIAADGTTKVEIYYDREYYTVVFDVNGGINGPEPIYAKYDTTFKVSDIQQPNRKGYVFEGWLDPDGNSIAGDVAIEGNVTYTAKWRPEKAQADYTIVLWGQNANDDEYSYLSSHEAWGNVGNQVTWNEDTLISHVHTDECWELTCGKEAHTHSDACGLNCTHTHTAACYGGTKQENPVDGKTGSANENIAQFKKLTDGTLKNGMVYRVKCDGAFSTQEYDLYPKFSEPTIINYTVHYYKLGTTDKVADDSTKSVMIGTTVTEKAKMGKDLNLVPEDMQNKYYPTNTSTSVNINQIDKEIIFYYTEATNVTYTVYYQDANGTDLLPSKTVTTAFSTVTAYYVPIPGYAPRQFSITQDLSWDATQNKIVFIYDPTLTTLTIQKLGCEDIDENQTFLFHVKGSPTDPNTKDIDLTVTVHGNGQTTVTDLPVGEYTVTEETGWSWRYTPGGGADRTFKAGIGGTNLIYQNSRTQTQWLDGDNYSVNHFDSKNQ